MTKRLIMGKHPLNGSYGLWLSLPGIDASTTVDPTKFLISPSAKNQMVLMSGISGAGTVYFPYTLSSKPYVYFNASTSSGIDYYPFDISLVTSAGYTECVVTPSNMTFYDFSGLGLVFYYLVINGTLP
jgi:hypothetical protein